MELMEDEAAHSVRAHLCRCGLVLEDDSAAMGEKMGQGAGESFLEQVRALDFRPSLEASLRAAKSGVVRDQDFESDPYFARALRGILLAGYGGLGRDGQYQNQLSRKELAISRTFLRIIVRLPEFRESTTLPRTFFNTQVIRVILSRLGGGDYKQEEEYVMEHRHMPLGNDLNDNGDDDDDDDEEDEDNYDNEEWWSSSNINYRVSDSKSGEDVHNFFGELLFRAYELCHGLRRTLRSSMGLILKRMAAASSPASKQQAYTKDSRNLALGTSYVLQVISSIIRGFSQLGPANRALLVELLLPLHSVPGKVSHSEPTLSLIYHPLMECLVEFVRHDPAWALPTILRRILMYWPHASAGNSPKEILMVQELSTFLELLSAPSEKKRASTDTTDKGEGSTKVSSAPTQSSYAEEYIKKPERRLLFARVAACLSSDNSLVCQAALGLWSVPDAAAFFRRYWGEVLTECWTALSGSAAKHWNATCKRQTGAVMAIILKDARAKTRDKAEWLPSGVTTQILESFCNDLSPERSASDKDSRDDGSGARGGSKFQTSYASKFDSPVSSAADGGSAAEGYGAGDHRDTAFKRTGTHSAHKQPEFVHSNFVFGESLGSGSFANVKHAWLIVQGKSRSAWPEYAIKSIDKKFEMVALREAKVMELLARASSNSEERSEGKESNLGCQPHRHLMSLMCPLFRSRRGTLHLVMEYAHYGDLHSQVTHAALASSSRRHGIGERLTALVTAEILSALSHIHMKGFVFSDLKPENVLIMKDGHIKLCDFGATRNLVECKRGAPLEGTAMYMAPEVMSDRQGQVTVAADAWSLGCLVHFALSGRAPAGLGPGLDLDQVAAKLLKWSSVSGQKRKGVSFGKVGEQVEQQVQHIGGDFPLHFSPSVRSFVSDLLQLKPGNRMTISQASTHTFLHRHGVGSSEDLFNVAQKPLPDGTWRQLDRKAMSEGRGNDFARRSFSLIVAPLPGRFQYRGKTNEDGVVDQKTLYESSGETELSWLPDPGRLLKPRLLSIHEDPDVGVKEHESCVLDHTLPSTVRTNGPSLPDRRANSRSRSSPMSLTQFPGRGTLKTGAPWAQSRSGPIRARVNFPPRSRNRLPPNGSAGTRRAPRGPGGRGARTNSATSSTKRPKLFVKGLDLTAG